MSNGTAPRELTFQALLLGAILSIILGAANCYLGLYAGMTVSASIPAAVVSMAILRGILKRGTIFENNIVQTIASSGESLAAGVIFTVPALVITQSWHQFEFWPTTLIAMTGGLLGVLFMIPLRRAMIIEEPELKFPEGTACAEVLKAGDQGGKGAKVILYSLLAGAVYKFLSGGIGLLKGGIEAAFQWGRSLFYIGSEASVALLSVGYIVGANVGALVFLGGVIGWMVMIPVYTAWYGMPEGDLMGSAWQLWKNYIRYMGVGSMAVGGIWTIYNVRHGIRKGIRKVFLGSQAAATVDRTDTDLRRRLMFPLLVLTTVAVLGLYQYLVGSLKVSITATVLMVIASFFFVAVASYIVGLVGSSNSPVSGMTICSLLFAAVFLHIMGIRGTVGVLAVLGIAGVVCGAACSAGDICQDLKTGQLIGATPWKQQVGEVVGAIIPAFVMAPVLTILQGSYGIGVAVREGVKPLVAPQATLFAKLAEALFLGKSTLPMNMVYLGMAIGVLIIIVDQILKARGSSFRLYIMAVAVGIYLPLQLSTPIFVGGVLRKLFTRGQSQSEAQEATSQGVLVASGLIAGESIMGVILAGFIFGGVALPISIWGEAGTPTWFTTLAVIAVLALFSWAARGRRA